MAAKKATKQKAKQPSAKKSLAVHSVFQHHMVLGIELVNDGCKVKVVQPGVSNAPIGYMTVPLAFGQKLAPRMLLKSTLSIEGLYERPKSLGTGSR